MEMGTGFSKSKTDNEARARLPVPEFKPRGREGDALDSDSLHSQPPTLHTAPLPDRSSQTHSKPSLKKWVLVPNLEKLDFQIKCTRLPT